MTDRCRHPRAPGLPGTGACPTWSRRQALWALAPGVLAGCVSTPRAAAEAPATAYADTLRGAFSAWGADFTGYQFRSTPIGRFGVGSIYLVEPEGTAPSSAESGWYLGGPDEWLQAPESERGSWMSQLVAEGSMGSLRLDARQQRALGASAGLSLLSLFAGQASLDLRKGVHTTVEAAEVRNRRLNWAAFSAALDAGRVRPAVADALRGGTWVLVAADVVLTGYRATVSVDESLNPNLAAHLRAQTLLARTPRVQAGFSLREQTLGEYAVRATEPVVAALLLKRPPPRAKGLGLPTLPPPAQWADVTLSTAALARLERAARSP